MEISTNNAATIAAAAPGPAAKTETTISSDFETFLKMLTVQMQNQDPLNPVQAEDFAVQLATFASVEQQVHTNDLLKAMQGQMGLSGMSQFAGWIGKDAKAPVAAHFDGTPITVAPNPEKGADAAYLVVRDSSGLEVQRMAIDVSDAPISWDGTTASGVMPDGLYGFTVESWKDGALDSAAPAEVYARVVEARLVNGTTVLVMEGGAEVAADKVTALRG